MTTKAENMALKYAFDTDIRFQDHYLRLIFTPLFGILIPFLSGLLKMAETGTYFFLNHVYFVIVSFLLWESNLWILRYNLKKSSSSVSNYLKRLFRYISVTAILATALLYAWYVFPTSGPVNHAAIWLSEAMIVIAILIIAAFYESVILIHKHNQAQIQTEKFSTAMLQAELESLKNKIDPHFIFNTLNTLSYLIESDSRSAAAFCDGLSDIYRYILRNKDRSYVPISDEIQFLKKYQALLQIRFGSAIQIELENENGWDTQRLIAPVTLQILIENAIKHNAFDDLNPLKIYISMKCGTLEVRNLKKEPDKRPESHGLGLKILNDRLQLLTNTSLSIENTPTHFVVKLPLPEFIK